MSGERFRVVFLMNMGLGYREEVRETSDLAEARDQLEGLRQLEAEGEPVRAARIDRAVVSWEPYDAGDTR